MSTREQTADAVAILHRRFVGEDSVQRASLERARLHTEVAWQIFALRARAPLSGDHATIPQ